jgi:hypothetical protein
MAEYVDEQELYIEPTPLRGKDAVGVIFALLALALIGVSGYVWLNPELSMHTLFARRPAAVTPAESSAIAAAQTDDAHVSCPHCGMYADKSRTAVAVMWEGGGSNTLDSFDCVFNYMADNKLEVETATVSNYNEGDPEWIDVNAATYLYDTKEVEGSMPPYVAAFADEEAAQAAQIELGGELMDFARLKEKWEH